MWKAERESERERMGMREKGGRRRAEGKGERGSEKGR